MGMLSGYSVPTAQNQCDTFDPWQCLALYRDSVKINSNLYTLPISHTHTRRKKKKSVFKCSVKKNDRLYCFVNKGSGQCIGSKTLPSLDHWGSLLSVILNTLLSLVL